MVKLESLLILAIDTSCDETSVAVLRGRSILSNIIASQVDLHKKWGGIVPNIARRAHKENIKRVYNEALQRAGVLFDEIDHVAATQGPGLAIALEVGLQYGQKLAHDGGKGFLPINHMEGHLLSPFALNSKDHGPLEKHTKTEIFPAIGVLISGGRTQMVLVKDFGSYEIIGETLDDAIGEAFDKVARMLDFGYPGGPIITRLASEAPQKRTFGLPVPMQHSNDLNFSYSGLKTACLYKIKKLTEENKSDKIWVTDFCYEFLDVATKSLTNKLRKALQQHRAKIVLIGGGVTNSEFIVRELGKTARTGGSRFFYPEKRLRADNAGMVGVAAYYNLLSGVNKLYGTEIFTIDRNPSLEIHNDV